MPYNVRTLAQLAAESKQYFVESVTGAVVDLWANTFRVLTKHLSLLTKEIELRRAWIFRQVFASTADRAILLRHGYELGILPKAATRAVGEAVIASTNGLVIPADLVYLRADGAKFRIRVSEVAVGSTTSIAIEAFDTGVAGNTAAGAVMTAENPGTLPVGLGATLTVDGNGLGGGADAEETEAYRARVLARKRQPPQGGSKADWLRWTREVPGVTEAFVAGFQNDERSVWVTFLMADRVSGIPTQADVDAVAAYLKDDARRPMTARVYVYPPEPVEVPIVIQGLSPATVEVRNAVQAELEALFAERMRPSLPGDVMVVSRSWVAEAIARAAGEERHRLLVPADDVAMLTPGDLPVLGAVTFN